MFDRVASVGVIQHFDDPAPMLRELFALVIIDFDWRYRLPIMPLLLILSAFGLTALRHHRASA